MKRKALPEKIAFKDEIARRDRRVAAVLLASRKDADLSQKELAKAIGWSKDVLANIENNRRRVTVSELFVFARCLRMRAADLFDRIDRW